MQRYLADLYRRRDLILFLVTSGLKAQHRNTFLGYAWWLLDPLLGAVIYYFVVVVLFGRGGPDYGAYLMIGLIVWRWLGSTAGASSRSIVSQAGIITQVYLPKVVFPITTTLAGLANFAFGLLVIVCLLLFLGFRPGLATLWLPYIVASQMLLSLVIAATVAYICVFVRDADTLVGHAMRLWFYGSPVIWREDMIPERLRWAVALNPMSHVLTGYRSIFMENRGPDLLPLLVIAVGSGLAMILVTYVYSRYEHRIIRAL